MPATECDIDHIDTWAQTRKTETKSLAPGCRHDHTGRHKHNWTYRPLSNGDYIWTSRLGHNYTTSGLPPPYPDWATRLTHYSDLILTTCGCQTQCMESRVLEIRTGNQSAVVDLTNEAAGFCRELGDGLFSIFIPHATAGVAILETGAGTDRDLLVAIDNLLPAQPGKWSHDHGSPGHGRDHVLPAFVSPSVTIPVEAGNLMLGMWQSIVLVDTNVDNPVRRVRMSFISA